MSYGVLVCMPAHLVSCVCLWRVPMVLVCLWCSYGRQAIGPYAARQTPGNGIPDNLGLVTGRSALGETVCLP